MRKDGRRDRHRRKIGMAALVAVVLGGVVGCAEDVSPEFQDYRVRNQNVVERRPVTLMVTLPRPDQPPPTVATADARLGPFVDSYRTLGEGPVEITVAGDALGRSAALTIGRLLGELGLRPDQMSVQTTTPAPAGPLTKPLLPVTPGAEKIGEMVLLSYTRYVVQVPECGNWGEDMVFRPENTPVGNFGCATQRNIGLMVQNPRDLIRMRDAPAAGDAARAQDVMSKYRTGKDTIWDTKVGSTISGVGTK
ncbi:MAG: CpaD family pilus assembly lipoprotein [Alphaproteobacteria bacterium]